jgi:hypothetical protein
MLNMFMNITHTIIYHISIYFYTRSICFFCKEPIEALIMLQLFSSEFY